MTQNADAIIVGGGIMGVNIALRLAREKLGKVLLLEKTFLGAGSTGKSGAILRQHYSHETTIRMARESLLHYRDYHARTGSDIGFQNPGMVFITHERDLQAMKKNVELQQSLGVQVEILNSEALSDFEPRGQFRPHDIAAWEPEAGYVDPLRTVYSLAEEAQSAGVEIRTGTLVTDVLISADQVTGVQTSKGETISAPTVINAGGPWAKILLDRLEIEMPLTVIRPEQAYLEPPADFGKRVAIYGDLINGIYWKPEDAGWTRVGKLSYEGDAEVNPDDYDEGVSHAFIEFCRMRISRRVPRYREAVSWGGCGALYTVTPDAHPLIGRVPQIEGLFLVSGFSGHGFKLGPAVGQGVASLITGSDPGGFDAEFFAVDRFDRGCSVTSSYEYGILG
ncbi:MAG: FAD-dependent oxidoreductase [Planctomycetota bacterium]